MNSNNSYYKPVITGIWKFSDRVSIEQLMEVANGWGKDSKYSQLYIRKVSKDQNGIGFMYEMPDVANTKEQYDQFFSTVTDQLKRQFGNDLVGWDLASSTIIIK